VGFREGRVDESIKYLQQFIQISENSKDDTALSHACSSLGVRLNCLVCIMISLTGSYYCATARLLASDVVLETKVLVSRRLEDKNTSLGLGLGLEIKVLALILVLTKKS